MSATSPEPPQEERKAKGGPKRWGLLLTLITIVAMARVATTHRVFTQTIDEPAHVAAGYAYLSGEGYTVDASHPPLARILMALPLKMEGIPASSHPDFVNRGNEVLYHHDDARTHVQRARFGNLLFLSIAIVCTALWARRVFGDAISLIAAALLACLPPFLGHAGLATTDAPAAAMIVAALFALVVALERPTARNAILLGLAIGAGVLSKFSFVAFFPVTALAVWLTVRIKPAMRVMAIAIVTAALVIWAGYAFDFGRAPADYAGFAEVMLPDALARLPLPAPMLFVGMGIVKMHNSAGHNSYLFGDVSNDGFWYYFPVLLFFKTPLPFLAFALRGAFSRKTLQLTLPALAILGVAMSTDINIGIRHILPLYPMLAIIAAYGIAALWRERLFVVAMLAWLVIGTSLAHPDYLAWFNEAAGAHPERIAVDSNLDWGQDVWRLRNFLREQKAPEVSVLYAGNAWLFAHGIHAPRQLRPYTPQQGWIVVSETALALQGRNGEYRWLTDVYRYSRVGKSLRVYYVP